MIKDECVLVIDDTKFNRALICNTLNKDNISTLESDNGLNGIKVLEDNFEKIMAITVDGIMPGMGGIEFIRIIKKKSKYKDIPVILITSLDDFKNKKLALELGAYDYLEKSVDTKLHLIKIKNAINFYKDKKKIKLLMDKVKEKNVMLEAEVALKGRLTDNLIEMNLTKDNLLAIIGHDLRGPIGNLAEMLTLVVEEPDKFEEDEIEVILYELKKTATVTFNLLESLLSWAKYQKNKSIFKPEKFNVKEIIDVNINLFEAIANNKKINLYSQLDKDIFVFGDKNMLSTVVRNLISNSLKYTSENGNVWIGIESKNDRHLISVNDNGMGISKEKIKEIFDLRNRNVREGTHGERGAGLGMILCKDFVEKNNGIIFAESEENIGTSIKFTIPA